MLPLAIATFVHWNRNSGFARVFLVFFLRLDETLPQKQTSIGRRGLLSLIEVRQATSLNPAAGEVAGFRAH